MENRDKRLFIGLEIAVTLLWLIMVTKWMFYPSTLLTLGYFWFLVWVAFYRSQWLPAVLVAVIPLEVSKQFIPAFSLPIRAAGYNVSYLDFFRFAQVALALRWLADYGPKRQTDWMASWGGLIKKDIFLWLPLGLFLVYVLSAVFSVDLRSSIEEIVRLLAFLVTFYMTLPYLKTAEDLRRVEFVIIAAGAILGVIAIGEYLTGHFFFNATGAVIISKRANATFADPNILARFLVVAFFFTVAELERQKNWLGRLSTIGILLLQGAGLGITGSRGGLLAFAAAGVIFVILVPRRRFTLTALVLMILGIAAVAFTNPVIMSRFESLRHGFLAATGDTREYLWRAGVAMVRDHPLLGVGVGAFGTAFTKLYAYFNPYSTFYVSLSHTAVLTILAETGFVGLSVLYVFIAKTLHRGWQIMRSYITNTYLQFVSAGIVAGVVAIFISAQGEGRFYEEPLLWSLWAMLVAANRLVRREL